MVLKIFKAGWFLSVLVTLANLLYVFAALPEVVTIQEKGPSLVSLSRDGFFYAATAILALVNALVYMVAFVYKNDADFRSWFYGQMITLNIFFVIALNFVSLFNSGERYDYSRLEFIIYGSILLFVLWALGWPIFSLYRRITVKRLI